MRKLNVGDKIRCIKRFKNIQIGTEITITGYRDKLYYAGELLGYCCQGFLNEHFELVE